MQTRHSCELQPPASEQLLSHVTSEQLLNHVTGGATFDSNTDGVGTIKGVQVGQLTYLNSQSTGDWVRCSRFRVGDWWFGIGIGIVILKNTSDLSRLGDVPAVILGEVSAFTEAVRVCTTSLFAQGGGWGFCARAEADGSFCV